MAEALAWIVVELALAVAFWAALRRLDLPAAPQ